MNKEKLVEYLEMKRNAHTEIVDLAEARNADREYIRLHKQSILTLNDILAAIEEGLGEDKGIMRVWERI